MSVSNINNNSVAWNKVAAFGAAAVGLGAVLLADDVTGAGIADDIVAFPSIVIGGGALLAAMLFASCGPVAKSGLCLEAPVIDGYRRDVDEIVDYSDTTVNYTVFGITQCQEPLAEDAITYDYLPDDLDVIDTSYDAELGDYTLVAQFKQTENTSDYGRIELAALGSNSTSRMMLEYPERLEVDIMSVNFDLGEPACFQLSYYPSGTSQYEWTIDDEVVCQGSDASCYIDAFEHTIEEGDVTNPHPAELALSFYTWYDQEAAQVIDTQAYIWGGEE